MFSLNNIDLSMLRLFFDKRLIQMLSFTLLFRVCPRTTASEHHWSWCVGIDYRMKYQRWKDIFIMSNIPEPYSLRKRQRGSSWLSSQESILESWCQGSSGRPFERKFTRTCWKDPRIEIWGCLLPYFCLQCDVTVLWFDAWDCWSYSRGYFSIIRFLSFWRVPCLMFGIWWERCILPLLLAI